MERAFSQGELFFYWKEMESHPQFVGTTYVKDRMIKYPKYESLSLFSIELSIKITKISQILDLHPKISEKRASFFIQKYYPFLIFPLQIGIQVQKILFLDEG